MDYIWPTSENIQMTLDIRHLFDTSRTDFGTTLDNTAFDDNS
jgi:hypothetical protein